MATFLLLTLSAQPPFTYRQPLLEQVKEAAPGWTALDADAFSDEVLIGNAARLVREASKVVVVFQAEQPDAPLGACQQVLEVLLQLDKPAAVFLLGQHRRLQAIFQARPRFSWHQAATLAEMHQVLETFLSQELKQGE